MYPSSPVTLRVHPSITEIPESVWDALLGPGATPFQSWAWLEAMEHAGCATGATGWHPRHLAMYRGDTLIAVAPTYVRDDSYGEFVYDAPWAGAAAKFGARYYPKLSLAVPFTPATGPRFLVRSGEDPRAIVRALGNAAVAYARAEGLSSVHVLFATEDESDALAAEGYAIRHGVQYHWDNPGYARYEDFLGRFDSKRRNQLRRESASVAREGITLRTRRDTALSVADAAMIYGLYRSTIERHAWGRSYLNERFFARVLQRMPHCLELVEAVRDEKVIAGAFNVASETHLYGRYWGSFEDHAFLHFSVCYYHSIAECIARGVRRFEGGAGGEHKLSRGFEPVVTRSAHWIFHPGLDRAVRDFVRREREAIADEIPSLRAASGLRPGYTPVDRVG